VKTPRNGRFPEMGDSQKHKKPVNIGFKDLIIRVSFNSVAK
jgi:hypothetical protein